MIGILLPGKIKVNRCKTTEGFFLLDAVISLLVVSVVIIEILVFVLNAGGAAVKTNVKITESIELRNRSAIELFEIQK
jgi:competence protein ComGC